MQDALCLYSLAHPESFTSIQNIKAIGIKVLSLCIQTNSLLSLMDLDLGISFGSLMYSRICMIMLGLL